MRAIIVDNEPDGLKMLHKMLALKCREVEVIATCSNTREGKRKINELNPDLIFLEVQLLRKDGFEILLQNDTTDFHVIFISAHIPYMSPEVQFNATDYLLKPIEEARLTEAIQRVERKRLLKDSSKSMGQLFQSREKAGLPHEMKLCVPTFKGFAVLKLEDIIFCVAEKNYTVIHLKGKKPIIVSRTLLEYEKMLEQASFLRIHRTYLINLQHVVEYHRGEGGTVVMSNGTEVEISRRKKEMFLARIKREFWN